MHTAEKQTKIKSTIQKSEFDYENRYDMEIKKSPPFLFLEDLSISQGFS